MTESEVRAVLGELGFLDRRSFSLIDYRHGHTHAILRGFPELGPESDDGFEGTVLEVYFAGVDRISCWKDMGALHLRVAHDEERLVLEGRVGPIEEDSSVFLLEPGSIESYVIAGRVYWAEFRLPFNALSPLDTRNKEEAGEYPRSEAPFSRPADGCRAGRERRTSSGADGTAGKWQG
ncbi:hypothetical protein [Streptomyces sp. NBC_01750]|uniref:hypothetical protein n=1 Tax=Streptomyces sp. NBC_01750 TaxID=2975928 RepID=UPI002DD9A499|nr:hypothetical protein [Streptomyces sp. NBC_01750]WSD33350.1 hypothetical protein OG966_16420 [Streptomyces sp. NBC_01750]